MDEQERSGTGDLATTPGDGRSDEEAVVGAVNDLVVELHPRRPPQVTLDNDLEHDLGLDSLAVAELLVRLEEIFGVSLPERLLQRVATPRDLLLAIGSSERHSDEPLSRSPIRSEPAARPQQVRTLVDSVRWHAETHPGRLHCAILEEGGGTTELTYGALLESGRSVATGLLEHGVSPGESVALMLPTGRDYFTTFLGILMAGAVAVPIYPPARPAQLEEHLRRHSRILDNARATLLVSTSEARPLSRLLRSSTHGLRSICTPDELPVSAHVELPAVRADDIALLQYTSGSTGYPKGVVLTHRHIVANIDAMVKAARAEPQDVFVSWLPLYHDMGLIGAWLGSLHLGMPLVSMSPLEFLVRPIRWLRAISDHRGTLSAAPNFAYELCLRNVEDAELASLDLSSWRLCFDGAEAVSAQTIRRFTEHFAPCGVHKETIFPVYGLAEATLGLTFPELGRELVTDRIRRTAFLGSGRAEPASSEEQDAVELVSCGIPLPGYELRIVDDSDHEQPERVEGHVQFRGPSATSGYFRNPQATRALFHGDWLDTGDLGYLASGELYVTGRVKDLVIRAGRNLHPDELEQAVGGLTGVRKGCVAVFGASDPAAGTERLVIVAETRESDEDAAEQIRSRIVATTIELLEIPPDEVILAPPGTIPKTSSGKLRRAETRARYETGRLRPQKRSVFRQMTSFLLAGARTRLHRARNTIGDAMQALIGWLVLVVVGLPAAFLLTVLPGRRLRRAVTRTAARSALRLSRTAVRVHGHDLAPGDKVIVANHASWVDGIALVATLDEPIRFVVGEVFSHQPVIGSVLRRIGSVFVERWDREQSVADARRLAELVNGDEHLVFFPEGGLSVLPGLRPFHLGAFVAAASAGVPVVPIAIRGTRRVIRPGQKRLRHGAADIVIGEPIAPEGTDWHAAVELRDAARAQILRHCGEPDLE